MNLLFQVVEYIRYRMKATTAHGLHSPFVFDLYNTVITDTTPFYVFDKIESVRSKMLLSNELIDVHDYGTGGNKIKRKSLSLKYIASHYLKSKKYAQLLFRIVNRFQPENILEIGTSLGITTMYLASVNQRSRVISLEGSIHTAEVAKRNFQLAKIGNIEVLTADFNDTLGHALNKFNAVDFIYFDGNHQKQATLQYFQQCILHSSENSVFVFDDIYWSKEMKEAWQQISSHPDVTVSIDLYSIGLVFFRKGIPKQHFVLRF
jgi:predicted O-methyltransferase YrrM